MVNPYEVSSSESYGNPGVASPGERPLTATLFGVLNLVFGCFGILSSVMGAAIFAAMAYDVLPGADTQPTGMDHPAVLGVNYANLVLGLILSVVLIISGVGLLKFKPYGRTLANYYGALTIGSVVISLIVHTIFVVVPATQSLDDINSPEQAGMIAGAIGGVIGGCIGLIFPILLLVFMNRREFKNQIMGLPRTTG